MFLCLFKLLCTINVHIDSPNMAISLVDLQEIKLNEAWMEMMLQGIKSLFQFIHLVFLDEGNTNTDTFFF